MISYKHNSNAPGMRAISGGKMSKKKKTMLVAAIVLGIAVLGLAAGVYAKYVASLTAGNGGVAIAKWAFSDDNSNATVACPLNYNSNTLVDNRIAPGTSGTCTLELSNENSEVGVKYTLKATGVSGVPSNLVLTYTNDQNQVVNLTQGATVTGTMAPGETGKTFVVNWEWPYYTSDADDIEDTNNGIAGGENGTKMVLNFSVSGEQVQPSV